jgi:hypothetical protein
LCGHDDAPLPREPGFGDVARNRTHVLIQSTMIAILLRWHPYLSPVPILCHLMEHSRILCQQVCGLEVSIQLVASKRGVGYLV